MIEPKALGTELKSCSTPGAMEGIEILGWQPRWQPESASVRAIFSRWQPQWQPQWQPFSRMVTEHERRNQEADGLSAGR